MMSYQDLDPDPDGDLGVCWMGGWHQVEDARGNHWRGGNRLWIKLGEPRAEVTNPGEEIEKNNRSNYEFTKAMNECVVVRDEQIRTQMVEIERKDGVIAEMTIKILKNERKIDELLEIGKKLERNVNNDGAVEETDPKGNNPVPENKPRRKTRWEPIGPSFKSSLTVEPFVKYFVVRVEDGKKRTMCPFQIETDLANQLLGPAD